MSTHDIALRVNGAERTLTVASDRLLLDVLREDLELTGTKEGCGIGVCGACSVIVDGRLVSSCLTPAVFANGSEVRTVEGLAEPDGTLSPLQDAFIRCGGFQCGICTPGQLMAATALLAENRQPSESDVASWMMGNLCRCTGYYQIVDSILTAAGTSTAATATHTASAAPAAAGDHGR
jgi:carbon-monoxide dehydrogenase small subunit